MNVIIRWSAVALPLVLLCGCALAPLQIAALSASGLSLATTGRTLPDHALSEVTQRDCSLFRLFIAQPICRGDPPHDRPMVDRPPIPVPEHRDAIPPLESHPPLGGDRATTTRDTAFGGYPFPQRDVIADTSGRDSIAPGLLASRASAFNLLIEDSSAGSRATSDGPARHLPSDPSASGEPPALRSWSIGSSEPSRSSGSDGGIVATPPSQKEAMVRRGTHERLASILEPVVMEVELVPTPAEMFFVMGSYLNRNNADREQAHLPDSVIIEAEIAGATFYRVVLEPFGGSSSERGASHRSNPETPGSWPIWLCPPDLSPPPCRLRVQPSRQSLAQLE